MEREGGRGETHSVDGTGKSDFLKVGRVCGVGDQRQCEGGSEEEGVQWDLG